ncbi:MAG: hypothetical protein HW387_1787 [Parachlamydiales bacterium]|nr:hypothetical protein [Parachlamydiales bacterium]
MGQSSGVLVGCDQNQEWLLFPWYCHIRKHNPEIPIAFGDLGMSKESRNWCENRGILIPASQIPSVPLQTMQERGWPYGGDRWLQDDLDPNHSQSLRAVLFRKPLLMKRSPFERTLYLDLDCQILGNLSSLFSMRLGRAKIALRTANDFYEMKAMGTGQSMFIRSYNSGVVLFEKNSRLLDFWIFLLDREIHSFNNDDRLLSFAISNYGMRPTRLALKYNWLYHWGPNPKAVIYHWIGDAGKIAFRLSI